MELVDSVDAMSGPDRFLLLSPGRCGSVMLGGALSSHPQIQWHGEPYQFGRAPARPRTAYGRLLSAWGKPHSGFHYVPPGMWCPSQPDAARNGSLGICKYCWMIHYGLPLADVDCKLIVREHRPKTLQQWHVQGEVLARFVWPVVTYMADRGLKIIILRRQNLLARSVSAQCARKHGIWHIYNNAGQVQSWQHPAVHIVPAAVRREATAIGHMIGRLQRMFPDALNITYEQLADETCDTLERIQEFLGVDHRVLAPRTQQNSRPWQRRVSNYEELREQLGDDPRFSQYLE